jgi:hypothetical protein
MICMNVDSSKAMSMCLYIHLHYLKSCKLAQAFLTMARLTL